MSNMFEISECALKTHDYLLSKDRFERFIYLFLKSVNHDFKKATIVFPESLTKEQRHRLHTFAQKGILCVSYGVIPNRHMEIEFSTEYLKKLCEDNQPPEESEPEQQPEEQVEESDPGSIDFGLEHYTDEELFHVLKKRILNDYKHKIIEFLKKEN